MHKDCGIKKLQVGKTKTKEAEDVEGEVNVPEAEETNDGYQWRSQGWERSQPCFWVQVRWGKINVFG